MIDLSEDINQPNHFKRDTTESIIGIQKGLEAIKNGEELPVEKAFNEIY